MQGSEASGHRSLSGLRGAQWVHLQLGLEVVLLHQHLQSGCEVVILHQHLQ